VSRLQLGRHALKSFVTTHADWTFTSNHTRNSPPAPDDDWPAGITEMGHQRGWATRSPRHARRPRPPAYSFDPREPHGPARGVQDWSRSSATLRSGPSRQTIRELRTRRAGRCTPTTSSAASGWIRRKDDQIGRLHRHPARTWAVRSNFEGAELRLPVPKTARSSRGKRIEHGPAASPKKPPQIPATNDAGSTSRLVDDPENPARQVVQVKL